MRTFLIAAFISLLLFSPALAKSHSFDLYQAATLNGVELVPGNYKLKLNEEEAEIHRGGKMIVKAKVEVQPLGEGVLPNTERIEGGKLIEIRMKKQVVVFVD